MIAGAPVYTAACPEQTGIPVLPGSRATPLGGFMKLKAMCAIACCFLGSALALSETAVAQQRSAGGEQNFPQPAAAREVTVTEIPADILTNVTNRQNWWSWLRSGRSWQASSRGRRSGAWANS